MDRNILRLKDGRCLSYAQYGDPKGKPLFYFHGWPSSRLGALSWDTPAKKFHLRIIAVDRPGYGYSDFQKNRTLLDWPDCVCEVADALGIGKFSVIGISGGGPYALVCAYKIPDRVNGVGDVCGLGPLYLSQMIDGLTYRQKLFCALAPTLVGLVRPQLWISKFVFMHAPFLYKSYVLWNKPEKDRKVYSDAIVLERSRLSTLESMRQGVAGPTWDARIYAQSWGFDLSQIKKRVFLWHGNKDANVPVAMAHYVAKCLPSCTTVWYDDDGHALFANHAQEIVEKLA